MLRTGAYVAILFVVSAQPIWSQEQQTPQPQSNQTAPDRLPEPRTTPVEQPRPAPDTEAPNEQPRDINWSNWALFIVGMAGVVIAIRTLKVIERQTEATARSAEATARSAKAAEDSIVANERQFRLVHQQWMDARNWDAIYRQNPSGPDTIDVVFELFNPTNMTVTLTGTMTRILDGSGSELVSQMNHVLAPQRDYPVSVSDFLVDSVEKWNLYDKGDLRITVTAEVNFIDAFGQERKQNLGAVLTVGKAHSAQYVLFDGSLQQYHPKQDDPK